MQLEMFEDTTLIVAEDADENVVCRTCKESKPLSEYYLYEYRRQTGVHRNCRTCYNKNCKVTIRLKKENPYPYRNPACDCCGSTDEALNLDHCHEKNLFRGWLCRSCNTGIGSLGDDVKGLEYALSYLRNHYER